MWSSWPTRVSPPPPQGGTPPAADSRAKANSILNLMQSQGNGNIFNCEIELLTIQLTEINRIYKIHGWQRIREKSIFKYCWWDYKLLGSFQKVICSIKIKNVSNFWPNNPLWGISTTEIKLSACKNVQWYLCRILCGRVKKPGKMQVQYTYYAATYLFLLIESSCKYVKEKICISIYWL